MDAVYISSYLVTECPSVASAAICSAQCASITSAANACSSKVECLCPTLSVIGPPCFSCISELGLGSDAAPLSSYLATDCPIVGSAVICSAECVNIVEGASLCSDAQCICPTLAASGPACVSCLSALGDRTDAATISSYLASDCAAATAIPHAPAFHITLPPVSTPFTGLSTIPTSTISSAGGQNTVGVSSQIKSSGGRGIGVEMVGAGYIQVIMLFSILTGLLTVFV
jgi:hypothetical protein